jgi:D-cysteine desulfhydrase
MYTKEGLMNLSGFPRRRYIDGTTPIQHLPRLSKLLGGPQIYIKRDDLLGLAEGGNKIRKLEFIVADALSKGADTLITCGAIQSNHCRLTLAASVKEGLHCALVLEERVPNTYSPSATGNNLLYHLLGAKRIKVVQGGSDLMAEMEGLAEELSSEGLRPYIIPVGASNPLGALGYVACAMEILWQTFEMGVTMDRVVCASGSGGTHAGLLAGLHVLRSSMEVVGINVSRSKGRQEELVHGLACGTVELLGTGVELPREKVICFDQYVGPGYSIPTQQMVEAVEMLARTEAILLDPVYTGKAMAGLLDLIQKGHFRSDEKILFLHTGGTPALYAYKDTFLRK